LATKAWMQASSPVTREPAATVMWTNIAMESDESRLLAGPLSPLINSCTFGVWETG
jgi:hypothetical protein